VDALAGELVRQRLDPELLLSDGPEGRSAGAMRPVEELRRVHRLRRMMGRGRE